MYMYEMKSLSLLIHGLICTTKIHILCSYVDVCVENLCTYGSWLASYLFS